MANNGAEPRVGVYICHCGSNIAGTVDVEEVTRFAASLPGVVLAKNYQYMCSDPGQDMIKQDIKEHNLNRVVVSSCSPLMHERTFRRACEEAGLNPFLFQMANIREHCSWVTDDPKDATEKAKRLVAAAVRRVALHEPLVPEEVNVNPNVLIIGGGIAGIEAALKLADAGKQVYLVEREPSIGGHMAMFDKTFPTLDCAACILTPKMVDVGAHPNIKLLTYSEVTNVDGHVGNFRVTVRRKPRYVIEEECNGCGECVKNCPVDLPSEFDMGLTTRKAVFRPFPQAVPAAFTIDKKLSPCRATCPAETHAAGYIALIAERKFKEALELIRKHNPFPGICGRVCHRPCERECTRAEVDEPIGIAFLKRFVADYEAKSGGPQVSPPETERPEKVAVIGAGPGGLTAAWNLRNRGYKVTVFEALPVPGGMFAAGIPPFRLPRDVVEREIKAIEQIGVEIQTNRRLGKDFTLKELFDQGYSAAILAIGAWRSRRLNVPGEDLDGVIHAIDFLREVNLGKEVVAELPPEGGASEDKIYLGQKVAVIGGGNAALDTARTALRLGAKEVTIYYRRTMAEMPAEPKQEVEETQHEGVKIEFLVAPTELIGEGGRVKRMKLIRMELGEPDESGRRRPVPIPGSEFEVEVDTVLPAIGQEVDPSCVADVVETTDWGTVKVDEITLQTSQERVFALGDAIRGAGTVIEAIADGNRAAESVDRLLSGKDLKEGREPVDREIGRPEVTDVAPQPRVKMPSLPLEERRTKWDEVELGYDEEMAVAEAQRCLKCGGCVECLECVKLCERNAIDHEMLPSEEVLEVGTIIVATGFQTFDPTVAAQYGYGRYDNVITSLEFERLSHASGPTGGKIVLKDGREPESVAIIHCVGSRDTNYHEYCSRVCCMYNMKFAHLVREKTNAKVYEFYIDLRAFGKGYEEFYKRLLREDVVFIRGKGAEVTDMAETPEEEGKLIVKCEDTLLGTVRRIPVDMVILGVALEPRKDAPELARLLNLNLSQDGFFLELHPKLGPVATASDGVFVAGACQGPKDIPDTVAQGAAAAAEALSLIDRGVVEIEPIVSVIDEEECAGCKTCIALCPYTAIEFDEEKGVSVVVSAKCKGCGTCVAACPSGAARQQGFRDEQIFAEIEGAILSGEQREQVVA